MEENKGALIASHILLQQHIDQQGNAMFATLITPTRIGQETIRINAWMRTDSPIYGIGRFIIITPEENNQKSIDVQVHVSSSKWLKEVNLAIVNPGWDGEILCIKMCLIIGFKASLHIAGITPKVMIENLWIDRYKIETDSNFLMQFAEPTTEGPEDL